MGAVRSEGRSHPNSSLWYLRCKPRHTCVCLRVYWTAHVWWSSAPQNEYQPAGKSSTWLSAGSWCSEWSIWTNTDFHFERLKELAMAATLNSASYDQIWYSSQTTREAEMFSCEWGRMVLLILSLPHYFLPSRCAASDQNSASLMQHVNLTRLSRSIMHSLLSIC